MYTFCMASDVIQLDSKTYTASKKAAAMSGYAQDYIGQLARSGQIDAQRVGGLWYVSMDSLDAYKRNSESHKPSVAPQNAPKDADTLVSFDGKDYVSASRAAKITGYNQDYIGQLARSGKILSRQIGNRWYIERDGLMTHKASKDAMLAAVQVEAVGLAKSHQASAASVPADTAPFYTYHSENADLMPTITRTIAAAPLRASAAEHVPVQVKRPVVQQRPTGRMQRRKISVHHTGGRQSGKTISTATKVAMALTVVIVLSYGMTTLKTDSLYAFIPRMTSVSSERGAFAASAASALDKIATYLEKILVPELVYSRDNAR